MRAEHLAIDGSVVAIEADADLRTQATATGWAIVPSLMRAHPFSICPAGHSKVVEQIVPANYPDLKILSKDEFALKGGLLRIAEVELPGATGETELLTVGAWEGKSGCLTTSLAGSEHDSLVEVFDTLQFSERSRGLAIDSPVTPRPREPMVIKEIPDVGVLNIRPAIPSTLEQIPKSRGRLTNHGELFRIRATSDALLFVGSSAVVRIDPLNGADSRALVAAAEGLRVEWTPRGPN